MNEQSRYGLAVDFFNAASNRVGMLLALLVLLFLAACSTPTEVEVTREVEVVVEKEVEVIREVTVETVKEVEVIVEVTPEVEVMVDDGGGAIRPNGIVRSIVNAPIVSDGNVTGALPDFVISLDSLMSPDVPGRTLLAGKQIRITLPDAFVNDDSVPPMDAFACGLGDCNTAIVLQGWPQHPIFSSFPPGDLEGDIRYEISMDGSNTLVVTALEDLDGSSPAPGPGIKTIHVILGSFVNPAPGQYEIVVEAETGVDGALEVGAAPFEVIAEPAPAVAFTSVFNGEGNPNAIYQRTGIGQQVAIPYHLLLWKDNDEPLLEAELMWQSPTESLIAIGDVVYGRATVTAPGGAGGQELFTQSPSEAIDAPISGYPTGHMVANFMAGDTPGLYTITFEMNDGNSVKAFVEAVALDAPGARTWHAVGYDSLADDFYIAGGRALGCICLSWTDLWRHDDVTGLWQQPVDLAAEIPDVEVGPMAFNESSGQMVILGGRVGLAADTPVDAPIAAPILYTPATGELRSAGETNLPEARIEPAFVYHPGTNRFVMFGGGFSNIEDTYGDTWLYDSDGDIWEKLTLDVNPPSRGRMAAAYDSDADRILMYGGGAGHLFSGVFLSDTWEFDAETLTWNELETTGTPEFEAQVTGAYDAQSQRFVIFGRSTEGNFETWAFNYTDMTWTNMQPEGGPMVNHPGDAVYHVGMDRVLVYGGNVNWPATPMTSSEFWAYDYDSNVWELIEAK